MTQLKQLPRSKWHPIFRALFDHAAGKPGAELSHPWGHSVFRVKGKTFVFLGGPDEPGLDVKPHPGSRAALLSQGKATVSHYIGRFGWVSLQVKRQSELKLALDLVDESYERNVPKRAREAAAAAANGAPSGQTRRKTSRKARAG